MPLYEYKCERCGTVFEVLQRFSDEPLKVHEDCGGALERLVSPSTFQFKGTGWYATDYARKSEAGKEAPPSSTDKGAADAKQPPKTEPKPASPPAAK
jgi:putative FmdB family regulatory protein